jgi:restriction system protein
LAPARVRKQIAEERLRTGGSEPKEEIEELGVDGQIEPVQLHWKDKLLGVLRSLQPDAFERLAHRILREAGFIKVEVTGKSGDGGIDGIGVLRVNLLSFHVWRIRSPPVGSW